MDKTQNLREELLLGSVKPRLGRQQNDFVLDQIVVR
ncbi:hypothetical protein AB7M46_005767 [Bradyrhizobium elkanii]